MKSFIIRQTDFGIDARKSRFKRRKVDGSILLTIDIYGSQKEHKKISSDDASEWSWTLYPPHFSLCEFPIQEPEPSAKLQSFKLASQDIDKYDVGLYMMVHNNLSDVSIRLSKGKVAVNGTVDIMGKISTFQIEWEKA